MKRAWTVWSDRLRTLRRRNGSDVGDVGDGGHPTPELLSAYQEDRLPPEADGAIQEHFVDCPECPELMLDLDRFTAPQAAEKAAPDLPDGWVEAAWRRLRIRLSAEARQSPFRWLRSTGFAWSLTAVLLPCVLALQLQVAALTREQRENEAIQLNPPLWNVEPAPDLRGDDPAPPVVAIPAGTRQFFLIFTPSLPPAHREYRLAVQSWQRKELWAQPGLLANGDGTFVVRFHRRFLPAGSYHFVVTGVAGDREAPFSEDFPVQLAYL
jgi:hypothetical protein